MMRLPSAKLQGVYHKRTAACLIRLRPTDFLLFLANSLHTSHMTQAVYVVHKIHGVLHWRFEAALRILCYLILRLLVGCLLRSPKIAQKPVPFGSTGNHVVRLHREIFVRMSLVPSEKKVEVSELRATGAAPNAAIIGCAWSSALPGAM